MCPRQQARLDAGRAATFVVPNPQKKQTVGTRTEVALARDWRIRRWRAAILDRATRVRPGTRQINDDRLKPARAVSYPHTRIPAEIRPCVSGHPNRRYANASVGLTGICLLAGGSETGGLGSSILFRRMSSLPQTPAIVGAESAHTQHSRRDHQLGSLSRDFRERPHDRPHTWASPAVDVDPRRWQEQGRIGRQVAPPGASG